MERLVGKRAIVTAAGNGIGRSIAAAFAAEGAEVLAVDIDSANLETLQSPRIRTRVIDVLSLPSTEVDSDFESVDILVNCVGWVFEGTLMDTEFTSWRRSFELNVDTMFLATRQVLPGMLSRNNGSIITISSAASSIAGFPRRVAYGAAKAALIGMTKALAADHVRDGVRFNAICPGTIETPSLIQRIRSADDPAKAYQSFVARQPLGRLGQPEEVAGLAIYLASDESQFMTGSVLVLDGGATL